MTGKANTHTHTHTHKDTDTDTHSQSHTDTHTVTHSGVMCFIHQKAAIYRGGCPLGYFQ